jgi:phosphinothricin acetyltransferase
MAIEFRTARSEDAAGILSIYAPYCESSTITFEIVPPTLEQMQERIATIGAAYPWLVAESDGEVLGYVYGTRFRERAAYRWTVEVAAYVAQNQQRRGFARALYLTLFELLRLQGYSKVIAGITLPNPPSIGLHESVGFTHTGIFPRVGYKSGQWLDVGWWQLQLQPEAPNPPEPRAFPNLANSPAVAEALATGQRMLVQ